MGTLLERPKVIEKESLGEIKERDRIRVTLDLTPSMKAILDQLAESSGVTQAEILRRAVAVLNTIKIAEKKKFEPALVDEDGKVVYKLVGF